MTRFADKVTILVRGSEMTASKIAIDKVTMNPRIEVRYNTEVKELHGEAKLSGVTVLDTARNATEELYPKGAVRIHRLVAEHWLAAPGDQAR